jgi:16S rRNA (guanine(1405)-N(7))-methyltransferase
MVKSSTKFRQLDDAVVEKELLRRFHHHPALWKLLDRDEKHLERNSKVKDLVRAVRGSLFPLHSLYYGKRATKRDGLLRKLAKKSDDLELHREILHCHTSTRERLSFYEDLYREIFEITGVPARILDLGCGLNPVSVPFMHLKDITYIASDFTQGDCEFLHGYFDVVGLKGEVVQLDLLEDKDLKKLQSLEFVDVCFMFKLADILDRKRHKRSELVLQAVNSRYIIVSFSTKTISGQPMDRPRRGWFEMMLKRLGYLYEVIEKKNEIFYVVKK